MIAEEGSELASELWAMPHRAVSSVVSYPEARAALAAARRGGRLSGEGHDRARSELESLYEELPLVGMDRPLARLAGELAEERALRGFDAVHLATALAVATDALFITWDRHLRRAATRTGCAVAPAD